MMKDVMISGEARGWKHLVFAIPHPTLSLRRGFLSSLLLGEKGWG
jgi:hypothetical protein